MPRLSSSPDAPARAQVRLSAQVLTCLALCLLAAAILYFRQVPPLALWSYPFPPLWQLLIGQGLALLAAVASYLLFRLTADSESTARTIRSYARLDLEGLNPVWISACAAVGEELLFRAALQPLLGIWITSLVFVVVHTPIYRGYRLDRATLVQAAGLFGASVALGLVFQYVGLLAAMLVHAWIDIVGLVAVRSVMRSRA